MNSATFDRRDNRANESAFQRLMRSLPEGAAKTFTSEQIAALETALAPSPKRHLIDFRVSLPFFNKRRYLVVLFGKESRSRARLLKEGQIQLGPIVATYGVLAGLIVGAMFLTGLICLYSVSAILMPPALEMRIYSR